MNRNWQNHLLTLPDTDFFHLVRLHLGPVKTPFHKQRLIERLAAYVQKEETLRRILALLDGEDARILTAIVFLHEPPLERLLDFLAQDRSYLEIHHRLLNLEERLLIYRDRNGDEPQIRLNPFLADGIHQRAVRPALLFPSREEIPHDPPLPWLSEGLLIGFLSWLLRRQDILKADGSFRRKALSEIETLFPSLMIPTPEGTRLFLLKDALLALGLVRPLEGMLIPILSAWREFLSRDTATRRTLLWASFASAVPLRPALRAAFIAALLTGLPENRAYAVPSLVRLASASLPGEPIEPEAGHRLIRALASLEVLLPAKQPAAGGAEGPTESDEEITRQEYLRNPHSRLEEGPAPEETAPLILQPTFDLTVTPRMPAAEALPIALAADIRGYDTYARYELTKSSIARAVRAGYDTTWIIEHLERLSGKPAPQNVAFSLDIWERELRALSLYRGRVLVADGELRHLVEHSEALRGVIRTVLAPGVYLLVDGDEDELRRAFERIGLELPPESGGEEIESSEPRDERNVAAADSLVSREIRSPESDGLRPTGTGRAGDFMPDPQGEAVERELFERLAELEIPREIRDELTNRIRNRLVLFPHQLCEETARQERQEARGLDYLGKVRLIEQALRSEWDLLELVVRDTRGEPEKMLVRPKVLEKAGTRLYLTGQRIPDQDAVRISIGKVGLVRKIRGSMMGD